jgi:hypothetical protein
MYIEDHHKFGVCSATFARLIAGTLATSILAGCLATTPIESDNKDVFQPAIRASFNVNGGDSRPASETRSGHAVEIGYQGTKVSSNQSLASGQPPVILNGTTFLSPNQLNNQFDLSYTDISWRMREFGGRPFGVELSTGLELSSLGIAVSSHAQHASQHFSSSGLQLGFGLIWRASTSSSLHARASYHITSGTGVNNCYRRPKTDPSIGVMPT